MTTPPMYIITKGEREQTSYRTFRDLDPWLVTHDDERAERLRRDLGTDRVLVSGISPGSRGKIEQQRWLFENHVAPDQWVIVADDNIRFLRGVLPERRDHWEGRPYELQYGREVAARLPVSDWRRTLPDTIARAESIGARLVGFAPNDSRRPASRWGTCSFVWGKLTLWRRDPLYRWDPHVAVLDDWYHTAEHLVRYGTVLIDYYTYASGRRYEPGGLGTFDVRKAQRERDIAYLCQKYPGLFRTRTHGAGEYDLRLVRNRLNFFAWREQYLATRRAEAAD